MTLWQTAIERAALVLLVAAVVVPVAQSNDRTASSSGRPTAGYSDQELTAMANSHPWVPNFQVRYQAHTNTPATAELTAIANSHPYVSPPHIKELTATAQNSARRGPTTSSITVQKPASANSSGFDWGDAVIGATSGVAFALLLAGALLLLLRRRSRGQSAGAPTTA